MGQRTVFLAIAFGSACSIIYNPNNIPRPSADGGADAGLDAPIPDANPAALMLTAVQSTALVEGQGSDGSRAALLVIQGQNLVPDAQVAIAGMGGSAMVSLAGSAAVSSDHTMLAVPVEAAVDPTCPAAGSASGSIPLLVTVSQEGGTVSQTIGWTLTCLPEVDQSGTGANVVLPQTGVNAFSRLVLAGSNTTISLAAGADLTQPLVVRVTGKMSIPGTVQVSANGSAAGPGGNPPATGDGKGAAGGSQLLGVLGSAGAGGAGYAARGTDGMKNANSGGAQVGSASVASFATNSASGGGDYDSTLGGAGAGSIELTAGGSLDVGGIAATGGQGGASAGGGAGGTIVLRAGTTVTLNGNLDISGGPANSQGGAGSVGRVRINTPAALQGTGKVVGTGASPTAYLGLAFDPSVPYVTKTSQPQLTIHGTTGAQYEIYTRDPAMDIKYTGSGVLGAGTGTVSPTLVPGLDNVCLVEPGGDLGHSEGVTCVTIAYMP